MKHHLFPSLGGRILKPDLPTHQPNFKRMVKMIKKIIMKRRMALRRKMIRKMTL